MTDVFVLSGHDIRRYFYDIDDADACAGCGLVFDITWTNSRFEIGKCSLEFGYTYDMANLVNDRFAEHVRSWPGVRLVPIESSPGWWHLTCDQVVPLDPLRSHLRREPLRCDVCGRSTQIAAPFQGCLADGVTVPDGLARTDQVFGSAFDSPKDKSAQMPTLLVNAEYAASLRAARFKGLIIMKAECGPDQPHV